MKTPIVLSAGLLATAALVAIPLTLPRYRHDHTNDPPLTVMVAKTTIPRGTQGSKIPYEMVMISESKVLQESLSSPSYLQGKTTILPIPRGAQIISRDFH